MRTARQWSAGAAAVAAGVLLAAGAAWACVPQPLVVVQPRASAPAGTRVTVVGEAFEPGAVELRWNGTRGELLARGTGPNFEADVTVPPAEPGLYTLVALGRDRGGAVTATARATLYVTGPDLAPPPTAAAGGRAAPGDASRDSGGGSSAVPVVAGGVLAAAGLGGSALLARRRVR